jgi:hypothetical protein
VAHKLQFTNVIIYKKRYAGGAVASMTSGYAMLTSVEAHGNKAQEGGAFYIQVQHPFTLGPNNTKLKISELDILECTDLRTMRTA